MATKLALDDAPHGGAYGYQSPFISCPNRR